MAAPSAREPATTSGWLYTTCWFFHNMKPQIQSPLFNKIPPEIRNAIFRLALQEYDNPEHLYERETYYTRPGLLGKKRVDTRLLRTCKKVYKETGAIPLSDLEVVFFVGKNDRRPPEYTNVTGAFSPASIDRRYCSFSSFEWSKIQHVRIIPQLYTFQEQYVNAIFQGSRSSLLPTTITITIRYTDWYWWEHNDLLNLNPKKINPHRFSLPASVNKVVMELETREGKRKELEEVIAGIYEQNHLDEWAIPRRDGKFLRICQGKGNNEWKWQGPTTFGDGQTFAHHPKGGSMEYLVKVLTWKVGKDVEADDTRLRAREFEEHMEVDGERNGGISTGHPWDWM